MYEADLARARELVPVWLRWVEAFTYPCLTFALVLLLADAGAWWLLRSLRANPQAHWTERARQLFRVRRWVLLCFYVLVVPTAWIVAIRSGRLALFPSGVIVVACLVSAWAARVLVASSLRERWMPHAGSLTWRSRLAMFIFAYAPVAITLGLSLFLPADPSHAAFAFALTLSAAGLALMLGASCWAMGWLGLARRVDLRECGIQDSMPFKSVWSVEVPMVNAFAFPLTGQVAVTKRAFETLSPDELAAVLRHEAAHLSESNELKVIRVVFAALFQAWGYVGIIGAQFGVGAAWAVPITLFGVYNLLRRRQHHEETRADDAAIGAGADASVYARALEKLHETSLLPAVMGKRMPHRDLHDRMVAAGVTPGWPKPEGVSRIPIYMSVPLVLVGFAILLGPQAIDQSMEREWLSVGANRFLYCVAGDEHLYLLNRGHTEFVAGDYESAITFDRAAAWVAPFDYGAVAEAALALCELNRCDEARTDLAEAERRTKLWPDPRSSEPWLRSAREAVARCPTGGQHAASAK
jgi:Zn-dependent protease with chaperone function